MSSFFHSEMSSRRFYLLQDLKMVIVDICIFFESPSMLIIVRILRSTKMTLSRILLLLVHLYYNYNYRFL